MFGETGAVEAKATIDDFQVAGQGFRELFHAFNNIQPGAEFGFFRGEWNRVGEHVDEVGAELLGAAGAGCVDGWNVADVAIRGAYYGHDAAGLHGEDIAVVFWGGTAADVAVMVGHAQAVAGDVHLGEFGGAFAGAVYLHEIYQAGEILRGLQAEVLFGGPADGPGDVDADFPALAEGLRDWGGRFHDR